MKRLLALCTLTAALAAPQAASARVVELGGRVPAATVSCPDNCQALTRVTAFQGRGGTSTDPFVVPNSGKILAFTVRLGSPNATQTKFFQDNFGTKPQVAISVLKRVATRGSKKNDYTLVAQSPAFDVSKYFGSAPTFPLDTPIAVKPRYVVALTVPTWAPVFAAGLTRDYYWRSSRRNSTKSCRDVAQNAQLTTLMTSKPFGCTYYNTRLYYTATYVRNNLPTTKTAAARKAGRAASARSSSAKGA